VWVGLDSKSERRARGQGAIDAASEDAGTIDYQIKKGGPREAAFLIRFTVHKTENPSRPGKRAVLEVILQYPCGQRGGQG
jgi:hypothetical protein